MKKTYSKFSWNELFRRTLGIFSILILFSFSGCGLPVADTEGGTDGGTDGVTGSGTLKEFWVGVKIDPALDDAENKPRFVMHQTDFPSDSSDPNLPDYIDSRCVADPDSTTDNDIFCVMHGDELDMAFHGVSFVVNAHASECNYLLVKPSVYWDAPPGNGPSAYKAVISTNNGVATIDSGESSITTNAIRAGTSYGRHVIQSDGSLKCGFDYSESDGKNCCTGTYSAEIHALDISSPGTVEILSAQDGSAAFASQADSTMSAGSIRYVYVAKIPSTVTTTATSAGVNFALTVGETYLYNVNAESLTHTTSGDPVLGITVTPITATGVQDSGIFTASAAHGLNQEDRLQIPAGGLGADFLDTPNLVVGDTYTVKTVPSPTTFTLVDDQGTDVIVDFVVGAVGGAAGEVQFSSSDIEVDVYELETQSNVSWGGKEINCLGGGSLSSWSQKNGAGEPVGEITYIPEGNVTSEFDNKRVFSGVDDLNYAVVNFFPNMDVSDTSTWPVAYQRPQDVNYSGAITPAGLGATADYNLDASAISGTRPFYSAECLDQDHEVKARIRFSVLDWNTRDEFTSYLEDVNHASGDPDYQTNLNGGGAAESSPFGDNWYNDFFDFQDLESWAFAGFDIDQDGDLNNLGGLDVDNDGTSEPYPNLMPLIADESGSGGLSMSSVRTPALFKSNPGSAFFNADGLFMGDNTDAERLKKNHREVFDRYYEQSLRRRNKRR